MFVEDVVEALAALPIGEIENIFKDVKRQHLEIRKSKVPADLVEKFKIAFEALSKGQNFTFKFTIPLKIELVVKADHEFGHPSDWQIKILSEESTDSEKASWFEETFKEAILHVLTEDPFCLERLAPDVLKACEDETKAFKSLQAIRWEIRDKYGIEAYDLLEENQ